MFLKSLLNPKNEVISTSEQLEKALRSGGIETLTGIDVTGDKAMRITAVFACVRIISESIAQVPLVLYKKLPDGTKEVQVGHPLHTLIGDSPNPWQTSFEWREMMQGHLALRGNAFSFINRLASNGRITELVPLHPDSVQVEQLDNRDVEYKVTENGQQKTYKQHQILHLTGLSSNGYTGMSPVSLHRESMGLSLAAEMHGARVFKNGAQLGGVLQHPAHLDDDAYKNLKESVENRSGVENFFKPLILEEGMEWKTVGITNEDAQYIETRKFQATDIARVFRVPPHMIGDLERATFSNIEQQAIEFVKYTIAPWATRWEKRLGKALLTPQAKAQGLFFEFNLDGLLRGDIKTRFEVYGIARDKGIMNANEIRKKENMNAREDGKGDIYLDPMNMKDLNNSDDEGGDEKESEK